MSYYQQRRLGLDFCYDTLGFRVRVELRRDLGSYTQDRADRQIKTNIDGSDMRALDLVSVMFVALVPRPLTPSLRKGQ